MSNEFNNLYEFGKFRFNAKTNTLWRDDELISLSPKALELLKLLIEKQGEVVSKQEIFEKVWADTFVEDGVLTQNIYTLRQTLGTDENGKQLIENIARRGYRLSVPIFKKSEELKVRSEEIEKPKTTLYSLLLTPYFVVALISLIALISFVGYRFLNSQTPQTSQNSLAELKFSQITDTGDVSYLTVSPDGNVVAFVRNFEIYLQTLADNQETKITLGNPPKIGCLQFSADGNSIFFGTIFNRDEKGNIFQISKNGGAAELIAENVWSGFSISPNGQNVAFVRKIPAENKQSLVVKNLVTKIEKSLKTLSLPEEFYWNNYPAWSADGKKIALVAVNQTEHLSRILLIDENGSSQDLKPNNFRNVEQIVWSAQENSLIAAANDGKNFQLWKISTIDNSVKRLTNDLNSYLGIAVSNDRKKLVSRQRIYFSNIWTAQKNDLTNLKQLTNGTSRNDGLRGLSWLDDENIVYTSNDEKIRDWNLWLLKIADGSRQKLTADVETQNDYPTVSPDKKAIYFSSDRNKQSRIWRIEADGKNSLQITFGEDETHHFPQISPNGKWLYFIIKSGRNSTIGRKSLQENSVQELTGKTNYTAGNFLTLSPNGKFLAFQNINFQTKSEVESPQFQMAFLSTDNPQNVELKNITAWQQRIEWSPDSNFFEYLTGNVKQSSIVRQSISNTSSPEKILTSNDAIIFNFAWSPSGEHLAISRGQLLRDVVLLTDFE